MAYTDNVEAELEWLKGQIVVVKTPITQDVATPFGYSVARLKTVEELKGFEQYIKTRMDRAIARSKDSIDDEGAYVNGLKCSWCGVYTRNMTKHDLIAFIGMLDAHATMLQTKEKSKC